MARWGGGNGKKLFSFIILLGAAVAALFANDAHGFITGQLLTVDGGYSLQTE